MKKFLLVAIGLLASVSAAAQDWPHKPLRLLVPFAAASTPDTFARILAGKLGDRLKQPVVVENKPGAGGMIGTDAIAKAVPDGYTIGVSIVGPLVNNTLLYKTMAYDPFRDLAPVTLAVNQPCVLVVGNGFPAATWRELLEALKRNPGKFNYASLGNGTNSHLSMELIANRSGTPIVQVPYPGSGQAVAAIVAGDVQMGCMPAISVMPLAKAGRLKAIGVASRVRTALLPGMPTLAEQGLAGFEANSWIGVVAPAATPAPILARLNSEIVAILRQPDVAEALRSQLMEPVGNTPEQFTAYMKEELGRWGPLIRQNRITLD